MRLRHKCASNDALIQVTPDIKQTLLQFINVMDFVW